MPDVVVTGASGFIGRAVCAELQRWGVLVSAVGRAPDPNMPGVPYLRVAAYEDVRAPQDAVCLHLAGENNAKRSASFPGAADEAVALARHLVQDRFARIVFASSALVYGDGSPEPRRETDPVAPRGAYAVMKRAVEAVFLGQGHVAARLANVYGPGMAATNIVSDILTQIPGAGPIRVHDASPVRDYLHLDDVAAGLAALALGDATGIFNLGTGVGTSVGQLAACLATIAGEEGREVLSEVTPRPTALVVDPHKMGEVFGWRARVGLADGLRALVDARIMHARRPGLVSGGR